MPEAQFTDQSSVPLGLQSVMLNLPKLARRTSICLPAVHDNRRVPSWQTKADLRMSPEELLGLLVGHRRPRYRPPPTETCSSSGPMKSRPATLPSSSHQQILIQSPSSNVAVRCCYCYCCCSSCAVDGTRGCSPVVRVVVRHIAPIGYMRRTKKEKEKRAQIRMVKHTHTPRKTIRALHC